MDNGMDGAVKRFIRQLSKSSKSKPFQKRPWPRPTDRLQTDQHYPCTNTCIELLIARKQNKKYDRHVRSLSKKCLLQHNHNSTATDNQGIVIKNTAHMLNNAI